MQFQQEIKIEQTIKIDNDFRLELCVDYTVLYNFIQKNRDIFLNTIPWVQSFNTIEDSKKLIDTWQQAYLQGTKSCYYIMQNENVAGFFCFRTIDLTKKEAEVGYMMDKDYQGKGILRKCMKFMIEYALQQYQIQRFILITKSSNLRSQNVGLKLGFQIFKRQEIGAQLNGVSDDQVVFELTKEQYEQFLQNEEQSIS
ncbi:GNAT family acetyltransferase (macronuclear) [Tetrahymena thermophila SB210]|uniref:GNAT family acetyltransferase n=1 Tax=Tetrahymena thermophila (strain SB210) TaxID=312017 RepID=I7LTV0_TETTS|nr:GNAT family acetyltransferase [Tetrahymena thermophila SB210]EAR87337.1 GNAT family acetyltransferase [Tetrahymena thermophila SB210]|eukprot:XP_001007582.1 GNAT family acetyltransferase [Tetrahymena thermophila SB210]